tara:strand:- start:5366 stop:5680 length:315 start_codon:yes stop_codon:yes gene_type:complete
MSEKESQSGFFTNLLMGAAAIASILFMFIVFPTSLATWYSRCFNMTLLYGFGMLFSAIIVSILNLLFPDEIDKYIWLLYSAVMSLVTIYGVYLQFTGKCDLGRI